VFETDDDIFASVTVRDFDGTDGDEIGLEVRGPSTEVIFSSTFSSDSLGFLPSVTLTTSMNLGESPTLGKYRFRAMFGGQTEEYFFYVGDGPNPAPATKPANNAFAGLWFDPELDGEGFNIVTAEGGTIVYFYGSDNRGNRVWLISDPIPGEIKTGIPMEALMFESTGGIFSSPVRSSRGLSAWGTAKITVADSNTVTIVVDENDGFKTSNTVRLAGVTGLSCSD